MPNWTANQLIIEGDKDKVNACLDAISNKEAKMAIDFNKIVPMPAILTEIKKGGCMIDGVQVSNWIEENGKSRVLNDAEKALVLATGYSDWYDWAIDNWGTKWNACEATLEDNFDGHAELRFDTAWSPPEPILTALRKQYPGLNFDLNYKNEDDAEFPHSL